MYTLEHAHQDALCHPLADMLAFMVGWLYQKDKLQERYHDLDDLPDSLREFIGGVIESADEFEATYLPQ